MNGMAGNSGKWQLHLQLLAVLTCLFASVLLVGCGGSAPQTEDETTETTEQQVQDQSQDQSDDQSQDETTAVAPKSSLNDYTWDEIHTISQEISAVGTEDEAVEVAKKYNLVTSDGKLDGTQSKDITLSDGTATSVQIAGFNHDTKTEGDMAGITFIFGDAISKQPMNAEDTNRGGWEESEMRTWLASDGLQMLPSDLQSQIVAVDKNTNNVGKMEALSSVTVTSDKLWLFSTTELCGDVDWYSLNHYDEILNAEGVEYKLFRDQGVTPDSSNVPLVKTWDGSPSTWWVRSPNPSYESRFCQVGQDGNPAIYAYANSSDAVVPGFCL